VTVFWVRSKGETGISSPGEGHQGRGPGPKPRGAGATEIAPPVAIVDPGAMVKSTSSANDKVAFIEPGQEHLAEVDGPDAIVDLVEADGVLFERIGDEE
jgi:hypothetical protein